MCIDWLLVGRILAAASPAVSWVLVIVGWKVISRDNNLRERRKELRSALNDLASRVRSIEESAHEYLQTEAKDKRAASLSLTIKRDLKRIAQETGRLAGQYPKLNVQARVIEFRQVVSGGDFESAARVACHCDSIRLYEVSDKASELIEALEDGYRRAYES